MTQSIIKMNLMKTIGYESRPWHKRCGRNLSLLTITTNSWRLQDSKRIAKPTTTMMFSQRNICYDNKNKLLLKPQNYKRNNHNENVHKPEARILAIFDFDQTIISHDSDTVVAEILSPSGLNKDLCDVLESNGWITYMIRILQCLEKEGFTAAQLAQTVRCIPEVPGMVRLIREVSCINSIDMIILSDANTFFITEWLNGKNLRELFTIISNPAQPKSDGQLILTPLMHQTTCKNCPSNLCKGAILKQLIEESSVNGIDYKIILYVGDGENDYCAVSHMQRSSDIVCARRNFDLATLLKADVRNMKAETPQIILWSDGSELLTRLQAETTLFSEICGNTNRKGSTTG